MFGQKPEAPSLFFFYRGFKGNYTQVRVQGFKSPLPVKLKSFF